MAGSGKTYSAVFASVTFILLVTMPVLCQVKAPGTSSPAFAEVLLRKTDLLAEVEALSADYTETNPKIIDLRYEVAGLDKYLTRILATGPSDQQKLTLALGRLMVKRASLDAELTRLSRTMNPDHPERKRARKRVEVFDAAIKEILP